MNQINQIYNLGFWGLFGITSKDLNDEFYNGLDQLDCNKDMKSFLESILKIELDVHENKGITGDSIKDKYKLLIENLVEDDGNED